ncbi:MAG: hypothetical protein A2138_07505 [Deltaproteobacteria bacterium RBG_16_71_12]|nr:MAG: hypothetical protein A2138_07505 [Deltaproteobacteria bacterium RBG_16_71_12]
MTPHYHLLSIIVPALNERRTIATILERLVDLSLAIAHEVIVVDDGSTDGTAELARRVLAPLGDRARVISQANGGKGSAVRAGLAVARGDVVVIQDADLEYDPADLALVLAPLLAGEAKAVFGSRILGPSKPGAPLFYAGGRVVTLCTNLLYGSHLTDQPTCYKMVDAALLRSLGLEAHGFELCAEMTAKILKRGEPIVEVPIHYAPRSVAEGKKIRPRDGLYVVYELLKWRLRR